MTGDTVEQSRHVSVLIGCPAVQVYDFAADPANLPQWAAGLATGVDQEGERTFAESPMGRIEIVFAPRNEFGVLDHDVITPDGARTSNPMRVVATDDGCEVIFSVRRRGMSDQDFDRDAAAVQADLETLRRIMTG